MLTAKGVSKSFFGNTVLVDFDLDLPAGEVHALLGHNGSGKSTFVKLLAGFHTPDKDSGPIAVDGTALRPGHPEDTHQAGLRFVHQHLGLLDELTVLENLRLGSNSYRTGPTRRINWRRERVRAAAELERIGLHLSPERRFGDLTAVEQTEVAIARAVQDEGAVRVIVLDEPTAALPDAEVEKLFGVVEKVRSQGVSVLYVTHRLEEVHSIADTVTVLRNGRIVGRAPAKELSRADLVDLIVGHKADGSAARARAAAAGPATDAAPALELVDVRAGEMQDIALSVQRGEIVGVAGLVGSGVHDVPRALTGQLALESGSVLVDGRPLPSTQPRAGRDRGLVVLPSRREEKLIQEMTVKENLTLTTVGRFFRRGRLSEGAERKHVRALVDRYLIKCSSIEAAMRTLSGGNQQKVAVARALQSSPRALVLDEPTQGVDVRGKREIMGLLREAATAGVGVLVCSSDLEELEEVCDRILVMRSGALAAELVGDQISRQSILAECYGS
ncbi:MAG TPA: sugar ABC transporter ATP-binding protein [Acidimicrobiales bacterium]|nr:sugar ABC transporter ATP-binding protein [Acidimicrobiales bacterium]